ncbi:hypothetical protein [Dishui Lake virophage 2]|nr:hypothetical protein [Dishui Lake virophage 2]
MNATDICSNCGKTNKWFSALLKAREYKEEKDFVGEFVDDWWCEKCSAEKLKSLSAESGKIKSVKTGINKMNGSKTTVITEKDNFVLSINLSGLCMMVNMFYNDHTTCYTEMVLDKYPAGTKELAQRLKFFENEDDFIADPNLYVYVFNSCIHCLMYMVWYGDYHRRAGFIVKQMIKQWEEATLPREQYDTNHRNLMECSALLDKLCVDFGIQMRSIGYEPTQMKSGETLSRADIAWFHRRNEDKQYVAFEIETKTPKVTIQQDGRKGLLMDFKAEYKSKTQVFEEDFVCCLCSQMIVGWGNNAQPLSAGRCCDDCNRTKVIPARLNAGRAMEAEIDATFAQATRLAKMVAKAKSKEEEQAELEANFARMEEERQRKRAEKEKQEKRLQAEKEEAQRLKKLQKQEEERLIREAKAERKAEQKRREDYLKATGQFVSKEDLKKQREQRLKSQVAEMTRKRK